MDPLTAERTRPLPKVITLFKDKIIVFLDFCKKIRMRNKKLLGSIRRAEKWGRYEMTGFTAFYCNNKQSNYWNRLDSSVNQEIEV